VFLTNIRPAALERLGLDFASVAAANPRLVYGLVTDTGWTAPTPAGPATTWPRSGPGPASPTC
jgi:crotonobetainyl-CoA:carnitine CoA-transferase CaiB-like acyl-CoA transferase